MNTKTIKKSIFMLFSLLLLCIIVPTVKVKAANVKTNGYYAADIGTVKSAYKIGTDVCLKKVKISKNKFTTYGNFIYYKSAKDIAKYNSTDLNCKKRTFTLNKKAKFYIASATSTKTKKISKTKAFKILKKLNSSYDILILVKNKKVTKIYFTKSK